MGKTNPPNSAFRDAVSNTPDISKGYKVGLTALGKYSAKVTVPKTVTVEGSVDIDSTTVAIYPRDNRWDYAIATKILSKGNSYYLDSTKNLFQIPYQSNY